MPGKKSRSGAGGKDAEQTRQRLVEACVLIIAERGWAAATSRTIAEAAKANPALINYHFGSKRALQVAAVEWAMAKLDVAFDGQLPESDGPPSISDFMGLAVGSIPYAQQLPEVRILTEAMNESLRDEELATSIHRHLVNFRTLVRALIESDPRCVGDAAANTTLCCALLDGLMLHHLLDPSIDTAAAMGRFVAMLYGEAGSE